MFAKEGYSFIIAAAVILIIIAILPKKFLVFIFFLILALMLWFFRDPARLTPGDEDVVVSAADGKIVEISESFLNGRKYKKISVFMNLFSVHVNRAPYGGTITDVRHINGGFVNAAKSEASTRNERNEIYINTPHGEIVAVQIAGLVARRTVSYVEKGDSVAKGDRIGMIKFSSRVDHYLPENATVEVEMGDKVTAGVSVIATMP
ncbi:MAG: phosphatidylserine decarboxylase family protein [Deferribacteraceae bacterium]|jgi:phosphatidylserine decarboxylase|nr:phosphatidylserine decarboxylase family protein [Deferribacteraceae bacterium]